MARSETETATAWIKKKYKEAFKTIAGASPDRAGTIGILRLTHALTGEVSVYKGYHGYKVMEAAFEDVVSRFDHLVS